LGLGAEAAAEIGKVVACDLLGQESAPRLQKPAQLGGLKGAVTVEHKVERVVVKGKRIARVRLQNLDPERRKSLPRHGHIRRIALDRCCATGKGGQRGKSLAAAGGEVQNVA
jgi:hypothetical protein